MYEVVCIFFFQAEDGIRYLVRSRGLGDVYKRQVPEQRPGDTVVAGLRQTECQQFTRQGQRDHWRRGCLLYTSDAADERSSVDLGGRRIIKKKKEGERRCNRSIE